MRNLDRGLCFLLASVVALPLSLGCGKTIGETLDDTTITTRVKTSLLNDPDVGGLRIDVDTSRSVVTLSGRVKSAAERDQAIALARRAQGVSEVKDALEVVPDGAAAPEAPAISPAPPAPNGGPSPAQQGG
jgi:hyperosmotically inducible protein